MLFGHETISHYSRSNLIIWMSMAFQAGLLNMGGFVACHRFVSHVTGFATFFGNEVSNLNVNNALGMLVVPGFFLLGAMVSGVLVDLRIKLHKKPRYYISFGLIFVLLLVVLFGGLAGKFGRFGEPLDQSQEYALVIFLCFICGIQNGTITTVSQSVVRTTHLTGITTDLGIGLVRIFNKERLELHMEGRLNLMRAGIISFFGLGSIVGGFAFKHFQYLAFSIPVATSGVLFALMLYYQVIRKPSENT
ncbi:MAG: YoaK family protein [Bacillota bacterium]